MISFRHVSETYSLAISGHMITGIHIDAGVLKSCFVMTFHVNKQLIEFM